MLGDKHEEQHRGSLVYMGVSLNGGTPKSSIAIGFSMTFTIHFGGKPTILGNTHIWANSIHIPWRSVYEIQLTRKNLTGEIISPDQPQELQNANLVPWRLAPTFTNPTKLKSSTLKNHQLKEKWSSSKRHFSGASCMLDFNFAFCLFHPFSSFFGNRF